VTFAEEWLLSEDNSFHSSCILQVSVNSLGGEGLVGNILQCFGHLTCGVDLSGGDEIGGMMNIGSGEFGRTSTQRFLKRRASFGAKSGDSTDMDTS